MATREHPRLDAPPRGRADAGTGFGLGTALAVAAALVLALALALDAPAVRTTAALAVCLVLPGLGWARRLRLRDLGDTVAMTVVLSLSLTAAVATGMAVTRTWSMVGGLAVLVVIGVLGLVPTRSLAARATAAVLGRTARAPRRRLAPVEVADTEDGWTDWYAEARERVDEERRRAEAEAEAAAQEWRDWYAESTRITATERRQEWGTDDAAGSPEAAADPGPEVASATDGDPTIDENRVVRTGSVIGPD